MTALGASLVGMVMEAGLAALFILFIGGAVIALMAAGRGSR